MPRWPRASTVDPDSFGGMLRRLRIDIFLSQNQLARRAGVDPAYLNRMEKGTSTLKDGRQHTPSRAVVLALAEALDVSQAQADRLLFAAGLAPQVDWQTRAVRAETALATIRQAFADAATGAEEPIGIRRHVG